MRGELPGLLPCWHENRWMMCTHAQKHGVHWAHIWTHSTLTVHHAYHALSNCIDALECMVLPRHHAALINAVQDGHGAGHMTLPCTEAVSSAARSSHVCHVRHCDANGEGGACGCMGSACGTCMAHASSACTSSPVASADTWNVGPMSCDCMQL